MNPLCFAWRWIDEGARNCTIYWFDPCIYWKDFKNLIRKNEFYMTLIFLTVGNLCYMFYTNLQKVLNTTVTRKLKRLWSILTGLFPFHRKYAFMLYHSISVSPECGSLSRDYLQYHQTWAVLLGALTCQWGDHCLDASYSHSYHNYNDLRCWHMSWSSRMRTYHCQVMLRPNTSS